jgi:hypothetical protein
MMKSEPRALAYTLTILGALSLGCSNTPAEGTGAASEGSTGDTDGSATANSNTTPTTTTQGSVSNSATDSTVSGNSDGVTEAATTVDLTTEGMTGTSDDTQTTSPVDTSDSHTSSTSTSIGPETTGTDTTDGASTTGGDTTTSTGGDTTTTGDTSTGEPVECGLQLKATIRDFKAGHPDFESYCCGVVKDLVKLDLGVDKKPAFNQVGNPKMLTDAPTFNQWYNNTVGVNMPTQVVLDLQEIQPGLYSYQNNAFFPIDDLLFGNEGNAHNFHFTTCFDTS